jgi:glucokinase
VSAPEPARGAAPYPRLVADIGGSTARFAWVERPGAEPADVAVVAAAEHPRVEAAIEAYLAGGDRPRPRACALGVAAPVFGDAVTLTNRDWSFSQRRLRERLGCERLLVVNDFVALAHGVDALPEGAARQVGAGAAVEGGSAVLLGPGTGLGVAGLAPGARPRTVIAGEGGHATLAATDDDEADLLQRLRRRLGRVSAENVISGPGIENLYRACAERGGHAPEPLDAAAIGGRAAQGDAVCAEAIGRFFAFLGGFAGDLALTFGARGGVFIGGGIVGRLGDAIDRSGFRARFEAKGRRRELAASIASLVLVDPPLLALRGADAALDLSATGSPAA